MLKLDELQGFFVIGTCEGFRSSPWRNDPTKFNHEVGISRTFVDNWGKTQTDTIACSVFPEDVAVIQQQAMNLVGKPVLVRVNCRSIDGKKNSFLSVSIPNGEKLMPLETSKQGLSKAS